MDLSQIVPSERQHNIKHPKTGKEIGLSVSLVSLDDQKLKLLKREITDERLRLERAGKGFTAKEIEDNRLRIVFRALVGWSWGKPLLEPEVKDEETGDVITEAVYGEELQFEGEQPPFNEKNFERVCRKVPWILDDLENEISDKKAFFPD